MNNYNFEDLKEGLNESFNVTVTQEMLDKFLSITGDTNPMHISDEYARTRGYNERIVYGMLTASFISTLAGVYLPGKNCLILGVETNFIKPVYVNDELTVKGTVEKTYPRMGVVDIKVSIFKQNGEKVLRGKIKAGVLSGQ